MADGGAVAPRIGVTIVARSSGPWVRPALTGRLGDGASGSPISSRISHSSVAELRDRADLFEASYLG